MRQRSSLGSIKQLHDKRYKVTVTIGYTYDSNGKKKQKRRSCIVKSMKEARDVLRKYDNKQSDQGYTLREVVQMYLQDRDVKQSTILSARSIFKSCLSGMYNRSIGSIQGEDIDAVLKTMNIAETTMSTRRCEIRSLFRYAKRKGFIEKIPDFNTKGNPRHTKTMQILPSVEEIHRILEYIRVHSSYMYLYHILLLIASSGIRIGEACALQWNNIDMSNNTISILSTITVIKKQVHAEVLGSPKTDKSTRIVPVDRSVLEIINKIPRKSQYVFFNRKKSFVSPRVVDRIARKMFNEVGYPKLRVYDFRHFHATQLLAHGVDIKTVSHRLGHSSSVVTLNTYTHYVADNDRKAANMIGNLVLKKCLNTRNTQ